MYQPNFCAECGEKIVRLRWRVWTSRSFCDTCSKRFRSNRLKFWALSITLPLVLGLAAGRAGRAPSPPLIIERPANSPLNEPSDNAKAHPSQVEPKHVSDPTAAVVYICGARTQKGKPCSRRVHGETRCWQHLGLPAILPKEKLLIKQ